MTVFFYTPAEVLASPAEFEDKTIRIGALVQLGSVDWNAQAIQLSFKITEDGEKSIPVYYQELNLTFSGRSRGCVEGRMNGPRFEASQLLVKHSEE
ncbi:MAG: hypothetical protein CM1200mP28_13930 [Deltaproteobacteria bacterium]|nr:MAG: hypothetical protein CM1200mP28_13930 [Deltaproteobacteria bacterium]